MAGVPLAANPLSALHRTPPFTPVVFSNGRRDGATSAGNFSQAHPGFEGTTSRVFCSNARVRHRAKRCPTRGPESAEAAMQFAWQTLDGATKPITGTPGKKTRRGEANQPLPDVLGSPLCGYQAGVALAARHPCGMLVPLQRHPALGCFGHVLDTPWLSEDCQQRDKAGGFTPKRFSVIYFEKQRKGRAGSSGSDAAGISSSTAVRNTDEVLRCCCKTR